jgi:molybdopterin synthase catalytic subunit
MSQDQIHFGSEPLDAAALAAGLLGEGDGALVSFAGVVRRLEGELPLAAIEYEIYASMARSQLERVLDDARLRWPRFRATIAHREGEVRVGEASVWIGVAAAHRDEAFAVCRFLIDELKARAPIWKARHLPLDAAGEPS